MGKNKITDIVKLTIAHLEKDAHAWWHQLIAKSTDYELGHLGWNEFKGEIENPFSDLDRDVKLHQQLSALRQTASVLLYIKEFCKTCLGAQKPSSRQLCIDIYIYRRFKPAVKIQVLLAQPNMLVDAELFVEKADMAFFASEQRQYDGELQRSHRCYFSRQGFFNLHVHCRDQS